MPKADSRWFGCTAEYGFLKTLQKTRQLSAPALLKLLDALVELCDDKKPMIDSIYVQARFAALGDQQH